MAGKADARRIRWPYASADARTACATSFAERSRARLEERRRSRRSPCARTRRAAGCDREEECGVRTPFQRDRDRIVHSKPFRRLKGKTQVFIDPAGDHYRTRMTHTLETTGIARVVARALRLNEDLVEAIGLGHDTGHTPFGHAGEEALDAALRERFGGRFRHNEQSLRIAERLNLTARGARRDPHAHRRARARDARGQDRPDRRPRRLHQPRHRRRDPLRDPRARATCRATRSRCSARPARSGSTRSSTTCRDLRARGRHRPERRDRRRDALAARVHVRARLPRARDARRARARPRDRSARSSTRSPTAATRPTRSPSSSPG